MPHTFLSPTAQASPARAGQRGAEAGPAAEWGVGKEVVAPTAAAVLKVAAATAAAEPKAAGPTAVVARVEVPMAVEARA